MSGLVPSMCTTFPNPKRSCSTSMPTCKPLVSEGLKPSLGTCALGKIDFVLKLGVVAGLGLEKLSFCFQLFRSSSKNDAWFGF